MSLAYLRIWVSNILAKNWKKKKKKKEKKEADTIRSRNWWIFDSSLMNALRMTAGKKLSVLARLLNFSCTNKKRALMRTFIESQFVYCPLI